MRYSLAAGSFSSCLKMNSAVRPMRTAILGVNNNILNYVQSFKRQKHCFTLMSQALHTYRLVAEWGHLPPEPELED